MVCSRACTTRSMRRRANWRGDWRAPVSESSTAKASHARKRGAHIDPSGYDAGKKVKGRKRHVCVDTRGLVINFAITSADVQDHDMIAALLKFAQRRCPTLALAVADGGYQGEATAMAVRDATDLPLEIIKRSDRAKGFVVLPKRWIVERTLGWLGRCRRLAKDCENTYAHGSRLPDPRNDPPDAPAHRQAIEMATDITGRRRVPRR